MKILIITVGNRQVGWRCEDGVVRCLGVSGKPDHVMELYQEIAVEKPEARYFARHLGKNLHDVCEVMEDFAAVELLLDRDLIDEEAKNGLDEVWLLSTDQPVSVDDSFRASDTTWLAKLMAGKIRQVWSSLEVKVWDFQVDIGNPEAIRVRFEEFIHDLIKKADGLEDLTLLIENKGSVPAISSGLEIYAAAFVRQFEVVRVIPKECSPMYEGDTASQMSATFAKSFDRQSLSRYFLPLEKLRIISAWERGDFGEAKIWLEGHKNQYSVLYDLAGYLEDATRQDMKVLLQRIKGEWLPMRKLKRLASAEQIAVWQKYDCLDKNKTAAIIWEGAFSIPIDAHVGRLSNAFFLMAQTLERLLYQVYKKDEWLEKQWIEIPESLREKGIGKSRFIPNLESLIRVWVDQYDATSKFEILNGIREKRNKIVHEAAGVSLDEVKSLWRTADFSIDPIGDALMMPLQDIRKKAGNLPKQPLLLLLYEWGLGVLRD